MPKPSYKPNYEQSQVVLAGADERGDRLVLNETEKEIIRVRQAAGEWLQGTYKRFPEALEKLGHPHFERKEVRRLMKRYEELWEVFCTFLVESYLDYTNKAPPDPVLAKIMGLSTHDIRNLKASDTFKRIYGEVMRGLVDEPIAGLTRARMADLAPAWYLSLRDILTSDDAPMTAKIRAITWYGDNFIVPNTGDQGTRDDWMDFLRRMGTNVTINVQAIPEEYRQELLDLEFVPLDPEALTDSVPDPPPPD